MEFGEKITRASKEYNEAIIRSRLKAINENMSFIWGVIFGIATNIVVSVLIKENPPSLIEWILFGLSLILIIRALYGSIKSVSWFKENIKFFEDMNKIYDNGLITKAFNEHAQNRKLTEEEAKKMEDYVVKIMDERKKKFEQ